MYSIYSAESEAKQAFSKVRSHATRHQIMNALRGKSSHLVTLDEALAEHEHVIQHDAGVQVIQLDEIVGTVGRTYDFDDEFYPKHDSSEYRWCDVAVAIYEGKPMPVIEVYHLNDGYYIIDGNHRVSIMKSLGQEFAEAHIIEMEDSAPQHCQTQEIPAPRFER